MKLCYSPVFYLLAILFTLQTTHAQQYRISNWFNDKKSATVFTFDDWSPGHGLIAVPKLVSRKLAGTFFVAITNNEFGGSYATMNKYAGQGVEYANHTVNHYDLTSLSSSALATEIDNCKKTLDSKVTGQNTLTLAYPMGAVNQNVVNATKKQHIAGRGIFMPSSNKFVYEFAQKEDDYYNVCTATGKGGVSASTIEGFIKNGITNGGMVVVMMHSIYNSSVDDHWYDAMNEAQFITYLDMLENYLDQTWNATFTNAIKYHKEKHGAKLSTVSRTQTNWTLNLTDTLSNNTIFNHPLTVTLQVGSASDIIKITQKDSTVAFTKIGTDSIRFNAVPDAGSISITTNSTSIATLMRPDIGSLISISADRNSGRIALSIPVSHEAGEIVLITMAGRIVSRNELSRNDHVKFIPVPNLSVGSYILRISMQGITRNFTVAVF
jgi:peptidoglycan/xylan/chitin deacetylase (PgdA/CDA1 family)